MGLAQIVWLCDSKTVKLRMKAMETLFRQPACALSVKSTQQCLYECHSFSFGATKNNGCCESSPDHFRLLESWVEFIAELLYLGWKNDSSTILGWQWVRSAKRKAHSVCKSCLLTVLLCHWEYCRKLVGIIPNYPTVYQVSWQELKWTHTSHIRGHLAIRSLLEVAL